MILSKIKSASIAVGAVIIGIFYFMIGVLKRENKKLEAELSESNAENELVKENAEAVKSVYSTDRVDLIGRVWSRNQDKIQK